MPDDTPPGIAPPTLPGTVPPAPEKPPKRPTTRAARRAQSAAKRATADKAPKKSSSSSTPARKAQLSTRITDALVGVGVGVRGLGTVVGSPALGSDGVLVCQHAPNIGDALSRVADNDPRVREALERVLTVSVYGQLLSAVMPLAIGIAANHGMVPPQLVAMTDPGTADEIDRVVKAYQDTHPEATQAELEAHVLAWMQAQSGQGAAVSAPAA